ncbi:hypothetical protein [Paenibacillus sp. WLX2291]|uniref:hypothetical protein n=1 Tax=Paenibacillus sp. WLX2291 TaxID=3296934 RepID=UPI0039845861
MEELIEGLPIKNKIRKNIKEYINNDENRVLRIKTSSNINLKDMYMPILIEKYKILDIKYLYKEVNSDKKHSGNVTISSQPLIQFLGTISAGAMSYFSKVPTDHILTVIKLIIPERLSINYEKKFTPILNGLNLKKEPALKYLNLKRIIIVEDYYSLENSEKDLLKLICYFIEKKYLIDLGIIIHYPNVLDWDDDFDRFSESIHDISVNDLNYIIKDPEVVFEPYVLELTKQMGLKFFKSYSDVIIKNMQKEESNLDFMIKSIIEKMLSVLEQDQNHIKELRNFFECCSLFTNYFKKYDIEEALELENLEYLASAQDSKMISEDKGSYKFTELKIREFFFENAKKRIPSTVIEKMYVYIYKNYPNEYLHLARLIECFSRKENEVISAYIVAYYFSRKESLFSQRIILRNSFHYSHEWIACFEAFEIIYNHHKYNEKALKENIDELLDKINKMNISTISKLCCYSMISIYFYEYEKNQENILNFYNEFLSEFNKLDEKKL